MSPNVIAPPADRSLTSNGRAGMAIAAYDPSDTDYAYHVETYRSFVKYSFFFAAHALVILALLAYFFA